MANEIPRQGIEFDDNGPENVPPGAIGYIDDKGLKVSFSYLDVWREEHKRAFTVAKLMEEALLAKVQQSIAQAIIDGEDFRMWAKRIEPILFDAGWWGKKIMTDPLTGEEKLVQLGSPSRLKLIYEQNMSTAFGRANAQALQSSPDVFPYLRYTLGPSRVHREEHAAWNGLVLRSDDPFWEKAMPPNGYNCRCEAIGVTHYEIDKGRFTPSESPTLKPRIYINKRTGQQELGYDGIQPGFAFNPGTLTEDEYAGVVQRNTRMMLFGFDV